MLRQLKQFAYKDPGFYLASLLFRTSSTERGLFAKSGKNCGSHIRLSPLQMDSATRTTDYPPQASPEGQAGVAGSTRRLLSKAKESLARLQEEITQKNDEVRKPMLRIWLQQMKECVQNAQPCGSLHGIIRLVVASIPQPDAEEVQILDEAYRQMFLDRLHTFLRQSHNPAEPEYMTEVWKEDEKDDLRLRALSLASSGAEWALMVNLQSQRLLAHLHFHHFIARRFCEIAVLVMMFKSKAHWLWAFTQLNNHLRAAVDIGFQCANEKHHLPISLLLRLAQTNTFQLGFFVGYIELAQMSWKLIITNARDGLLLFPEEHRELREVLEDATTDLRRLEAFVLYLKHAPRPKGQEGQRNLWVSDNQLDSWFLMNAVDCQHWPFFSSPDYSGSSPSTANPPVTVPHEPHPDHTVDYSGERTSFENM